MHFLRTERDIGMLAERSGGEHEVLGGTPEAHPEMMLVGIDHGLTFHVDQKLRTVIWDYCGEAFPDELIGDLGSLRFDKPRVAALEHDLSPLVSAQELEALFQRWDRLLANPCFPELDPYRNVPWPPF